MNEAPAAASPVAAPVRTMILVVSLATATNRRQRFAERAADATVPWSFMDACTSLHPALRYDEDRAIVVRGRPLGRGEIGCYSSHYEAWRRLMESDADQLIVFEDDVIVDWRYIEALANIDLSARGIHYLRLFFKHFRGMEKSVRGLVWHQDHVITLKGLVFGTQGYVITRSGAERFLEHCRDVVRPIDDALDRSWDHGIPNLAVYPSPLVEEFTASTIEANRFDEYVVPERLKLRRKIEIHREKLRRRLRHITGRGKRDPIGRISRKAYPAAGQDVASVD